MKKNMAVHFKDLIKEVSSSRISVRKVTVKVLQLRRKVHVKDLCMEGGIPGPSRKKKMAVHVKDLCKEGSSGKSSSIKKAMAVHVKDLCKEGGSPSPPIKKKMTVRVK